MEPRQEELIRDLFTDVKRMYVSNEKFYLQRSDTRDNNDRRSVLRHAGRLCSISERSHWLEACESMIRSSSVWSSR